MQVNVLFFGMLREVFGKGETLTMRDRSISADVIRRYRDRAPDLGWDSVAVAVNQQYASMALPLNDGDEVALLPPVSGGIHPEQADAH
jgi:molybdopterin converting factor small subunit